MSCSRIRIESWWVGNVLITKHTVGKTKPFFSILIHVVRVAKHCALRPGRIVPAGRHSLGEF